MADKMMNKLFKMMDAWISEECRNKVEINTIH